MNKKQKLRNAVILGLLMSSVTVGSVWAESLVVENIENDNAGGMIYDEITGILGDMRYRHDSLIPPIDGGLDWYGKYNNSTRYDNISVVVKNNYNLGINENNKAVGVTSKKDDADAVLKAENNITVNVETRNDKNGYGVLADDNGRKVDMISSSGTIQVSALKTKGHQASLTGPEDIDYSTANVFGISAYNNGTANLFAGTNIIITAGYDKTAAGKEEYTSLKQGDIYGISNTGGTVDLTAGNTISITANSANGNAYGIYTDSNEDTNLKGNVNITAVADETGKAYGIYAENGTKVNIGKVDGINVIEAQTEANQPYSAYGIYADDGSKVDIIGDTYVHGDNGAIVIIGNGINNNADGESEKQFTADGNLFVSADSGTVITIDNGASEHVTGNLISASGDEKNAYSNISLTDGSSLTVDGYAVIQGGKTGLELNNSAVTFGKDGVSNYIIANDKAVSMNNNSALTVNGNSMFVAASEESTAIEVAQDSQFTSNGSVTVGGGARGIVLKENGQFTVNDASINFIKASAAREDVVNQNEHYNAVNVGAGAKFDVSGKINILQAGNLADGFGSETAVSVVGSDTQDAKFTLNGELGNLIQGAVYAQNGDVEISSTGSNVIYSSAHGYQEGDESAVDGKQHLVAALYAAENADINLTAINGVNVIKSSVYFNPEHENDREITVWAENGGNVNITGAVYIAASNYGNYTVDDDGNPVKGNALGIAVSAGGRDIDVENGILKPAGEIGEVNINYGSDFYRSMIVGDIVAGYGGEINITSNSIMPLVDEEFTQGNSLNVKGNILAANGGSTTVDFGTGGYWEGRADDYGDANLTDHEGFYNPAFSNEIVEGGEVNITMQHGMWNVTAQSWLTSFNGDNNIIDMVSYEDNGTHAVSIKEMIGKNNTFVMGLNNKDHGNSDMLYIKGGDANIDVVVSGTIEDLDKVSEENGLRFATVGEGITFGKEENGRKYITGINTGMFNTRLYVKDSEYVKGDVDNDDYNGDKLDGDKPGSDSVEDFFKPDEDTPEVLDLTATNENINADNWEIVDFAQDGMSDVGKTVLDLSKVNYSNAVYMDRFNKRMGEARFIDGNEGMWVRLRHDRIGKEDSFRSMNTMYEMGYDVKQVKEDGEHRVGFAIDYMDGSSSFSQVAGTGEVSRKGLWMYDSWMGEKGHYRDFVAKWGHLSNDFEFMAGSDEAKADFSNNVYSISAEFGKKNDIGNSWYFEPQAQVQYAHVTGAEYTTSLAGADQTEIRNDAFNSLIARAGFRLGRDISNTSTVYFKGDVLHEFLGDQDVFAKDSTTSGQWQSVGYDHSGTWYDIGFGFATKINKASYAYLDFEKSFGNDYDETYQINAGLQWTF